MPDIFYLQINGLCFIAKTGSWQGNSLCGNCCLTNSSVPERWPPQPPFFVAVAEGYVRLRSDRNPQHTPDSPEYPTKQTQPRFTRQLLRGLRCSRIFDGTFEVPRQRLQPPLYVAVAEGYVRSRSDRNPQLRELWRLPLTFGETVVAGAEYNPQARQQQHQQYPWKDAYPDLIQQHASGQCADRNGTVPDHYVQ